LYSTKYRCPSPGFCGTKIGIAVVVERRAACGVRAWGDVDGGVAGIGGVVDVEESFKLRFA